MTVHVIASKMQGRAQSEVNIEIPEAVATVTRLLSKRSQVITPWLSLAKAVHYTLWYNYILDESEDDMV